MSQPPRIRFLESPLGRRRRQAAVDFLSSFPKATEILVVASSRDVADDLVRQHASQAGASFGVHRYGFRQLVVTVAASELASAQLTPATALGLEAVAARATFQAVEGGGISRLSEVAEAPGFARSLAVTLEELRLSGVDTATLEAPRETLAELTALANAFEKEIESARIADHSALLRLATWAWRRPHWATLRKAPILLLDLPIATRREREFVDALVRSSPSVLATIPAGDHDAREALRAAGGEEWDGPGGNGTPDTADAGGTHLNRLGRWLFSDEDPPEAPADDDTVRFLSAPGEGRECVEIVRRILDEAEAGVPFDEMAVFLRSPETYSAHLETAFRRAGVPALFARGTKRPDPSGRAFLALLSCKSERLSAKRFAEYLSFAQVPDLDQDGAPPTAAEDEWTGPAHEDLGPAVDAAEAVQLALFGPALGTPAAPAADSGRADAADPLDPDAEDHRPAVDGSLRAPWKWEELLVEAAVIGGQERWQRRLAGLANELQKKCTEALADDPEAPRVATLERDLANLVHLERFALPVIHALDSLPLRATWGEWLDALARLAPRVLRRPERVLEVLAEMRPMASVGPVGVDEVRSVLSERLSTLQDERPANRYGHVFVATPDGARGREFRVVFVPGLAERVFPRRPREDPLLLDEVRSELSPELRRQEQRGHDERMLLRVAVGAAGERVVLSYPRVDVAEGRPRVPSFYMLDVVRATRGTLPDWEALEREAEAEASARLAWPAPADPRRAVDSAEHDLASLEPLFDLPDNEARGRARYLLELNDHLARALRSQWARWWRRWWPADGIVRVTDDIRPILERQRLRERAYSVTALERFARCPYRFFLSAIHRLQPREEAVPLVTLDPLTRGSLVHEVQAHTLRLLREDDRLPLTSEELEDARTLLDETVDRVAKRYEEDLAPAILRVWLDEVEAIRADLRVWLRNLAGSEWTPAHFELSFGLPLGASADPAATAEEVVLDDGWRLRGAIDLVERGPAGLRVTDHKTGIARVQEGAVVGGGESLQPVLYSLAAEKVLGGKVASARLSYCTARGGFVDRTVEMNEWARLQAKQVLDIVDRAVGDGRLHPAPVEKACQWCDFRSVCGPSEERRVRRKDSGPLDDLFELRRLP